MDAATLISHRLRSHRLTAPVATPAAAAAHMLATQAQEFWGGRWALAQRSRGAVSLSAVDAAFDRGEIVRSWTMRGTIHAIAPRDLGWVLGVTGERQIRGGAAVHRAEGIDDAEVSRLELIVRRALGGGDRLTRSEMFALFEASGSSTVRQRGYHLLTRLSMRAVICQGPVVPREGGITREQYFVLVDEWVTDAAWPADPVAEMLVRFVAAHGPAGARDFAWWAGLPLGAARGAVEAASDRLVLVDDVGEQRYEVRGDAPRRSPHVPRVMALPPFEEYYLSYADRTVPCAPEFLAAVGPSMNGIVKPILVADGEIVGVWTHSLAVGRHRDAPVPELFTPGAATDEEIVAALERYRDFVAG